MPSHTRRLAPAVGLALVVFLVAAVAAVAGLSGDPVVVEKPESHRSPSLEGPFEVEGQGLERIAILREPADLHLPPASAGAKPGSESALAMSLAAQGVDEPVPAHTVSQGLGEEVTVAELGTDACVGVESLATCGSPQAILEGHVVAVELCSPDLPAGSFRVLGMAPDGVGAVRIEMRDGTSSFTLVRDNTYEAIVDSVPTAVAWRRDGADGLGVPAPVPAGFGPQSCEG